MPTDIELSKSQLAIIIQSGGFLGTTSGNLGKKTLLDLAVTLAKHVLVKLATKATFSLLDKFERKISGQEAVGAGKEFNLFIFNADMDENIKIAELIEKPGILIDLATETGKPEIKKNKKVHFLGL